MSIVTMLKKREALLFPVFDIFMNLLNYFFHIKLILEKIGFKIEEAENGLEVMEKLRGKNYNLLLLDVQMPYMDGLKTIKAIREKREYDRLHVIALTAQAGTKERDEMNEAGCNGYITKPIDKKKLREEILTVYNGHKISSTERGEK